LLVVKASLAKRGGISWVGAENTTSVGRVYVGRGKNNASKAA